MLFVLKKYNKDNFIDYNSILLIGDQTWGKLFLIHIPKILRRDIFLNADLKHFLGFHVFAASDFIWGI